MKLIGCYNVYNEAEFLEESLKSIRDKVDEIILIDGAYRKFPHKVPWSTDGTLELARKYADKLIETKEAWSSEIFKRNQYLIGEPGDVYLVIDGDEIWQGELRKNKLGNYRIKETDKDGDHEFPRMFYHQLGLHYERFHYQLFQDKDEIKMEWPIYPHGHLIHKERNDINRIEDKKRFYSLPSFDN